MMSLFDDEQIMRTYTKDIEKETERKTAEKMIRKGKMTLEEIAEWRQIGRIGNRESE